LDRGLVRSAEDVKRRMSRYARKDVAWGYGLLKWSLLG
jgi:hypothetical protein